jgi:hypothetical protein
MALIGTDRRLSVDRSSHLPSDFVESTRKKSVIAVT